MLVKILNNLNKIYDYILFIETLEHLNKPKKIIRKYLEFCNEKILVTVPYKEKKWKEHLYFFDENSFKDIREFKKHFILILLQQSLEQSSYRYQQQAIQ